MEDKIIALEDQVRKAATPLSPGLAAQHTASALEIDNETLREQIQHLQKKLSMMEDTLEDAQAVTEREEAAMRERVKRFKEKEESMRNELTEGRKAIERVAKAEALAKSRIEEVEEALRESTLALENARAEIEILRTDATVCRTPWPPFPADLSQRQLIWAQTTCHRKVLRWCPVKLPWSVLG